MTQKRITVDADTFIELVRDVKDIKDCLMGDDLHPKGLVDKVNCNRKDINTMKQETIPSMENKQARFMGFWGGLVAIITIAFTTLMNWIIYGRGGHG